MNKTISILKIFKAVFLRSKKKIEWMVQVNNSLDLWSDEISLVEECISIDSNSSRVEIHYSASGISSGSLDIHSKRSDHWAWGHSPGRDLSEWKFTSFF